MTNLVTFLRKLEAAERAMSENLLSTSCTVAARSNNFLGFYLEHKADENLVLAEDKFFSSVLSPVLERATKAVETYSWKGMVAIVGSQLTEALEDIGIIAKTRPTPVPGVEHVIDIKKKPKATADKKTLAGIYGDVLIDRATKNAQQRYLAGISLSDAIHIIKAVIQSKEKINGYTNFERLCRYQKPQGDYEFLKSPQYQPFLLWLVNQFNIIRKNERSILSRYKKDSNNKFS